MHWVESQLERWNRHIVSKLDAHSLEDYLLSLAKERVNLLSPEYGSRIQAKHRHMRYHDFFVKRIHPGERVLDIGCGIGAVAYDVAEKSGARVVGFDLNADYVAIARQRFAHSRLQYVLGDAL